MFEFEADQVAVGETQLGEATVSGAAAAVASKMDEVDLLQQFQRGMQAGELPAGLDPEAAATLFVGIVQGLVMQSMLSGRPAAMQAQAGAVFAIYLRGIRAAA